MKIENQIRGKKSRASGSAFERKVREDLENKGWIVFKNHNDVEFIIQDDDVSVNAPQGKRLKGENQSRAKSALGGVMAREGFESPHLGIFKQAKSKFNPFTKRVQMMSGGFPDFICIRKVDGRILGGSVQSRDPDAVEEVIHHFFNQIKEVNPFQVRFVECKTNGYLDKIEKEKVKWIIENLKIPVFIASKTKVKNKIVVEYKEFDDKKA